MPTTRLAPRWLRWSALGLFCAAWLPFVPVLAATAAPVAPAAEATSWLTRLNTAAIVRNYRGTMVYTAAGGVVSSSRVTHVTVGDQVYERTESLDGHQQRVYRHNDLVHSVWPHKKVVVVEQTAASPGGVVSTRRKVEPRALAYYSLTVKGSSVVAGRAARILLLEPKDGLRFAQRLLADEDSGLLLRADVLDAQGRVLESSAFTDVEVGQRVDPAAVLDGMKPAGFQILPSRREAVDWSEQGWRLKAEVPGFQLVGCVQRPPMTAGGEGRALQAMFSDGLSFVSLFIEPWREQAHPRALAAELGATNTVMQRLGDHWVTAMGDVPRQTLEHFVGTLERRR
jgi:sigma-E factor negative regulatory protein RseB